MNLSRFGCAVAAAIGIAIAALSFRGGERSGAGHARARSNSPAPAPRRAGRLRPLHGERAAGPQAPRLEVDPLWPQPSPFEKHWALGSVTGVAVDSQDHIWVTHRGVDSLQTNEKGPTLATWAAECCYAAPQVLEFDVSGKLLDSWGGPGEGYQWPQNPSGIAVDSKGNVWIAAAGAPGAAGARGARGALQPPRRRSGSGAAAPAARWPLLQLALAERRAAGARRGCTRRRAACCSACSDRSRCRSRARAVLVAVAPPQRQAMRTSSSSRRAATSSCRSEHRARAMAPTAQQP